MNSFRSGHGTSTTSVAGGPVAANPSLVDGVPITDTNDRPIVIPAIESVQDVKTQTLTYDAQVGRTDGGALNPPDTVQVFVGIEMRMFGPPRMLNHSI